MLDLIEHEIAPRFYERADGLPRPWLEMVRRTLAARAHLLATRMLRDYVHSSTCRRRPRRPGRTRPGLARDSYPKLQSRPRSARKEAR